jgi:hypothetical protein
LASPDPFSGLPLAPGVGPIRPGVHHDVRMPPASFT